MDIKQLIYLCNLERERHFGRAAEASFVSQPTLSMRLKNLERELGLSLINRSNNFDGFTPEGERVLSWAREIVSVYQGSSWRWSHSNTALMERCVLVWCRSAVFPCQ